MNISTIIPPAPALSQATFTTVILAGGKASRLGVTCVDTPKAMLEFGGRPFLEYVVEWLLINGCEVVIGAGHNSDAITEVFAHERWAGRGVRVVVERVPLGTAGAIPAGASSATTKDLFICNGDTVLEVDLRQALSHFRHLGSVAMAVLTARKGVPNEGAVAVADKKVITFAEGKMLPTATGCSLLPVINLSSTGSYFFQRSFVEDRFPRCGSLEHDVLPLLSTAMELDAYDNGNRYFFDYGTPERLEELVLNAHVLKRVYSSL